MRYYVIAGEPSGDLHASSLLKELKVVRMANLMKKIHKMEKKGLKKRRIGEYVSIFERGELLLLRKINMGY